MLSIYIRRVLIADDPSCCSFLIEIDAGIFFPFPSIIFQNIFFKYKIKYTIKFVWLIFRGQRNEFNIVINIIESVIPRDGNCWFGICVNSGDIGSNQITFEQIQKKTQRPCANVAIISQLLLFDLGLKFVREKICRQIRARTTLDFAHSLFKGSLNRTEAEGIPHIGKAPFCRVLSGLDFGYSQNCWRSDNTHILRCFESIRCASIFEFIILSVISSGWYDVMITEHKVCFGLYGCLPHVKCDYFLFAVLLLHLAKFTDIQFVSVQCGTGKSTLCTLCLIALNVVVLV